ncbi:MAG: hypothetical protein QOG10_3412 [Kribbellaceae bacterium]|jgi:anti-sigma factor RsiW|nr:hypothetical protein [Kribbellaceae bacterium]
MTGSTPKGASVQVSDTKATAARTPEQIEADIAATRARLASTVDDLVDRAHPRNVVKHQVEQARAQVFDESGRLRTEKLVAVGAAAVAVIGVLLVIRRLVGRR